MLGGSVLDSKRVLASTLCYPTGSRRYRKEWGIYRGVSSRGYAYENVPYFYKGYSYGLGFAGEFAAVCPSYPYPIPPPIPPSIPPQLYTELSTG